MPCSHLGGNIQRNSLPRFIYACSNIDFSQNETHDFATQLEQGIIRHVLTSVTTAIYRSWWLVSIYIVAAITLTLAVLSALVIVNCH